MARIRTIKPEFFTSEDIVSLTPLARLLYIALWCEADREGRMAWKPKTFKMRYFPGDSCSIEKLCDELLDADLVVCYGEKYAFIPAFHAHQHINPRETATQIPEPDFDASSTRAPRVSTRANLDMHCANQEVHAQGGREGKGREYIATPDGVAVTVWQDFVKHRKAKKSPITDTAMQAIQREADKAGWTLETALSETCARGWTGFKAEWVTDKQGSQPTTYANVMAGAI